MTPIVPLASVPSVTEPWVVSVVELESDAVMVSAVVADMLSLPALVEFESVTETVPVVVSSPRDPPAEPTPGITSLALAPQATPARANASGPMRNRIRQV